MYNKRERCKCSTTLYVDSISFFLRKRVNRESISHRYKADT